MRRALTTLLAIVLLVPLGLSAAAASTETSETNETKVLDLDWVADDNVFEVAPTTAEPGTQVLRLTNQGGNPHTVTIDALDFEIFASGGQTAQETATLQAGVTYEYYCAIHPATMNGEFTVSGGGGGTVPVVSAAVSPAAPDGSGGWYVSPVTVTLSVDDPEATVEYRLGTTGAFTAYAGPVVVSADGMHTVQHRGTNAAGTSPVGSVAFQIDRTPPTTTASLSGTQDGGSYVGSATLTLTAADATSGVATRQYRVGGGATQTYTAPVVFSTPGSYTVEYRSVDVAGNTEELTTITFTVVEGDEPEPTECEQPDTRPTVVIGDVDTGVPNVEVGGGCTIDDLIDDESDWATHGRFLAHVLEVARELRAAGVIDSRELGDLTRAAVRSQIGRRL
ncbi:MAG TPA: cupredoxin domain-containing protein [Egibacteraceae bacterium]